MGEKSKGPWEYAINHAFGVFEIAEDAWPAIMNDMVPIRHDLRSKMLFQCLRIRYLLRSPWGFIARALIRKKTGDEVLIYSGFTVFKFPPGQDSVSEVSLVRGAIDLFITKAPFLARQEHLFDSIILSERAENFDFGILDKCCLLNPSIVLRFARSTDTARIILASHIVGAATALLICRGRFGYAGLRSLQFLTDIAQIRFLRKCLTRENHLDILAAISMHSEDADKRRTNRNYYRLFLERDLEAWT